jgi:hypothetical protein
MVQAMRTLMSAAIVVALAGSAYGQTGIPMGIPLEPGGKAEPPPDPVKENEYRSTLHGLPNQKPADPWGSVRNPPAPAAKKAPAAPAKTTTGTAAKKAAPKDASAGAPKDAAATKKTN